MARRFEIDALNAKAAREALTDHVLPECEPGDTIVLRLDPSKRELASYTVPEGPWEMDFSCYVNTSAEAGADGAGDAAPPPGGDESSSPDWSPS